MLSPDPDRPDRPANAREAKAELDAHLARLQAEAPRRGLGAAKGAFVDHVARLAERYGERLFVCFDDPRVPPTTDPLEGFFGEFKGFLKKCSGRGSTANSVVQSLGGDLLLAYHEANELKSFPGFDVDGLDPAAFQRVRAELAKAEVPARRRRSFVRNLEDNLGRLMERWRRRRASPPASASPRSPRPNAAQPAPACRETPAASLRL